MQHSDIEIDPLGLDKECVRQPSLILQATSSYIELREEYEALKEQESTQKARLSAEMRADPEAFELPKVTEAILAEALSQHHSLRTIGSRLRKKKSEVDKAYAYVTALDHKKKALDLLVQLHSTSYFGEVRTKR